MPLYALEDVDDALDVTRSFLTPVDRTTWLKLAVVVFFLGTPGAGLSPFQFNVAPGEPAPPPEEFPDVGPDVWVVAAAIAGLALLVGLAFAIVGAVMEFVFVESLRSREVRIRRY